MMEDANAENYVESFYDAYRTTISRGLGVMVPACVVSYDRDTHAVMAQPLVALDDGDGYVPDGIVRCTAWRPYAGRFLIDVPLDAGDTGWIIAADSDTDAVKENCVRDKDGAMPSVWAPRTGWRHLLQHGMFIPDRWGTRYMTDKGHVTRFGDEDAGRMVVQSADGSQRVSIGQTDIKVYATNATVNAEQSCTVNAKAGASLSTGVATVKAKMVMVDTDSMSVTAASGVKFKAPDVTVDGKLTVLSGKNGVSSSVSMVTSTDGVVTGIS